MRLANWGKSRSRHAQEANLESRAFVKKALEAYLEKLDPYRLLFTQGEVKKFQSEAHRHWRKWLREKKCEYFGQWTDKEYQRVRDRLDANLKSIAMPKPILKVTPAPAKPPTEEGSEDYPKFTGFAADEKELKSRLSQWVERIHQGASPVTLKAYGGDTRRLVTDAIVQLLFEIEPDAHALLAKAALSTMDPYSTYFSPDEFEDFYYELAGGTSGVGIKVRKVPAGLLVEKIVADSPAGRSKKLKEGHIIIAVDRKKVAGLSTTASKSLLKGADGTRVKLELVTGAGGKPYTITLTRKHFTFEESKITHRVLKPTRKGEGGVAVITIPSFYGRGGMGNFEEERSSSEDLRSVVNELVKGPTKPSAMILDLRGNPGGFLEEAVAMAGTFIGDEPVVEVVETDTKRILRDDQTRALYQGPLVLLLDEETASASEVLAGALKDHQRAVLVGAETTYGKGSVQKLFHLDDELMRVGLSPLLGKGVVKLTTSVFYSPLGHTPANGGVRTHIPLPTTKSEEDEPHPSVGEIPEETPFLDEASMAEVKKREEAFRPRLSALEELSKKRVELLVQQDLLGGEDREGLWELDEAVAIANDFAALQTGKDLDSAVSLRPNPVSSPDAKQP